MHKPMSIVGALVAALLLTLVTGGCSSSGSSPTPGPSSTNPIPHNACWSAVDELSNELSAAASASDLPAEVVLTSFRACGTAGNWKKYAGIDKIADEVSGLGDTSGSFNSASALALLCQRFDQSSTSPTCKR
jgi:hypothetical protein